MADVQNSWEEKRGDGWAEIRGGVKVCIHVWEAVHWEGSGCEDGTKLRGNIEENGGERGSRLTSAASSGSAPARVT
jgi:hypothetical protein